MGRSKDTGLYMKRENMTKTADKQTTALKLARAIAATEALAMGAPEETRSIETLKSALEHWDEADTAHDAPRDDTAIEITSHELRTSVHLRLGRPWHATGDDPESAALTQALNKAANGARAQAMDAASTEDERARALDDTLIIERVQNRLEQVGIATLVGEIGWRERVADARAERAKHPEDGALLEALAASGAEGIEGKRFDAGRITQSMVHPKAWSDQDEGQSWRRENGWWTLTQVMVEAVTQWCAHHPRECEAMAAVVTIDNMIVLWWKQKWGQMRWEITTPGWVHPALWDLIHEVAHDLERLSAYTCEGCGRASKVGWPLDANGELNGYVTTGCEDCERAWRTECSEWALEREQAGHAKFEDGGNSLAEVEIDIEQSRESKRRGAERITSPRRSADPALVKKLTDAIADRQWGPNQSKAHTAETPVMSSAAAKPKAETQLFQITGATAETRTWTRTVGATGPWEALKRACAGNGTESWASELEDAGGRPAWTEGMEETHGERAATERRRNALEEAARKRVRAKRRHENEAHVDEGGGTK